MRLPRPSVALRACVHAALPAVALAACDRPAVDKPAEEEADTADTAALADTGDTADGVDTADTAGPDDTADTSPPLPGDHTWAADLDAPDLRLSGCGTDDEGVHVLAPGPDLDGDALPELAVGAPGHDGAEVGDGVVYVLRGSDLAAGVRTWDAFATVRLATGTRSGGFGSRVAWVDDRDGDGLDDLVAQDTHGNAWTVAGADLAAGGEVSPIAELSVGFAPAERIARWDDVDGDGRDDWLVGAPDVGSGSGYEGAVAVVLDPDFTLEGLVATAVAYGASDNRAGSSLVALATDQDGDGIGELATIADDEVLIVGSAALLAGGYLRDAALATAPYMTQHEILTPGDADGDGVDDLILFKGGNKVCAVRGGDPDGDARICYQDGADLGPAGSAAIGPDLDGDGVRDLWLAHGNALVAWDVATLFTGVRRAIVEVALPEQPAGVVVGNGSVWVARDIASGGGEADVAWAFLDASPTRHVVTLGGGRWGGLPSTPAWHDVTGDGLDELILFDDGLAAFDGAGLAAGGERTFCDATWTRSWPGVDVAWIHDVDGDGTADALIATETDEGWAHEVWPGPVAVGAADGQALARWSVEGKVTPLGCDVDGDGIDDFAVAATDGSTVLSGAAVLDPGEGVLGAVDEAWPVCLPDLDGDGRHDLYLDFGTVEAAVLSAELVPGEKIRVGDAVAVFDGSWYAPEPLPDLDGDGADELGWWVRGDDAAYHLCLVDPAALLAAYDPAPDEVAIACVPDGAPSSLGAEVWTDQVLGDTTPDLLLFGYDTVGTRELAVRVVDGAALGAASVLVTPQEDGDWVDVDAAGPGPDVLGAGAGAIWLYGGAGTLDARVDVLYARP